MKCENIKEATTTCTNEASPGLVFCRGCLWQHSEELYKADRARREEEAKTEEAPAPTPAPTPEPTPEREEGKKANDPQWYIDRTKEKKRKRHWGDK